MSIVRHIAASIVLICLSSVAAMGFEPMTATIRVSSGNLYDYVIIGESPLATDGYDNAYDTIAPGNLNADMGQPYITALIVHPQWKGSQQELRGDIRSPAGKQEWQLVISSSLPKGTPLTITLRKDQSILPNGMKLTVKDRTTTDLAAGSYILNAPGPGKTARLAIIVEQ